MRHPLEAVPTEYRKPFFLACLGLTFILASILQVLDQPLKTPISPCGIVSFEFARTPENADAMIGVWTGRLVISTFSDGENSNFVIKPADEPFVYNPVPMIHAAFSLGLDYLFMPAYALALAFGILLAMQKHTGWLKSLGAVAGYGAFAAALFDGVENFALWQVLSGAYNSTCPAVAAFCASIKFGLLIFGGLVAVAGLLRPRK